MTYFAGIISRRVRAGTLNMGLAVFMFFVSYAAFAKGQTEFERFSLSFSREVDRAEQNIEAYSVFVKELSEYEKSVGDLLDSDYTTIEEILSDIPGVKKEKDVQIQRAKDTGRSVSADGYYTKTKEKMDGWDNAAYTAMHIETKLSALDQADREAENIYGSIDLNLLKRPNKPFNADVTRLITQAHIEIASAQSDIAAKDWTSGKASVDRANSVIKSALSLELNDIEQYQLTSIQNELKKVSSAISLGSTLNKSGSIIEDAAKGAAGILGGIGEILKGVGERLQSTSSP
jgi:hypothetical protein